MSLETFVRGPRVQTKASFLPTCASFLQTLSLFLCVISTYANTNFLLSPLSLLTCLVSAKSLQEFAAVLQNLEDERTRMVRIVKVHM